MNQSKQSTSKAGEGCEGNNGDDPHSERVLAFQIEIVMLLLGFVRTMLRHIRTTRLQDDLSHSDMEISAHKKHSVP